MTVSRLVARPACSGHSFSGLVKSEQGAAGKPVAPTEPPFYVIQVN